MKQTAGARWPGVVDQQWLCGIIRLALAAQGLGQRDAARTYTGVSAATINRLCKGTIGPMNRKTVAWCYLVVAGVPDPLLKARLESELGGALGLDKEDLRAEVEESRQHFAEAFDRLRRRQAKQAEDRHQELLALREALRVTHPCESRALDAAYTPEQQFAAWSRALERLLGGAIDLLSDADQDGVVRSRLLHEVLLAPDPSRRTKARELWSSESDVGAPVDVASHDDLGEEPGPEEMLEPLRGMNALLAPEPVQVDPRETCRAERAKREALLTVEAEVVE